MSDDPARFTDEQRETFRRVAVLIRSGVPSFTEAGRWLDGGAGLPEAAQRLAQVRAAWQGEARGRRQIGKRQGREAGRAYLVPPVGRTLRVSRTILARSVLSERATARRPPTPFEVLQHVAALFANEPPNYDAMRPDLAERQARRVLLVAWLLTDPDDLTTDPAITALQRWPWGEHPLEFLGDWPDGDGRPLPRLLARVTLLDPDLPLWERLARDAMRVLETGAPSTGAAAAAAVANDTRGTAKTAGKKGGRRSHRQTRPRPLTAKQLEAFQVFAECQCNYSAAAKKLGLSINAARDRIEAAYKKLGRQVPTKASTQSLPADRRGGSAVAGGPKPAADGRGRDDASFDRRLD